MTSLKLGSIWATPHGQDHSNTSVVAAFARPWEGQRSRESPVCWRNFASPQPLPRTERWPVGQHRTRRVRPVSSNLLVAKGCLLRSEQPGNCFDHEERFNPNRLPLFTWKTWWISTKFDLLQFGQKKPFLQLPRHHGAVGIKAGQLQVNHMLQGLVLLYALHLLRVVKRPILTASKNSQQKGVLPKTKSNSKTEGFNMV